MILIIFVSALHAHTEREKRSETKHTLEKSRLKIPQKKKNERRKATNTTNEDE